MKIIATESNDHYESIILEEIKKEREEAVLSAQLKKKRSMKARNKEFEDSLGIQPKDSVSRELESLIAPSV